MTEDSSNTPVVVVGAGMGGLAAAFALRAHQVPVILVERHRAPGGKMRQLQVAGRALDSGPTVFTMRWVFEALFARAGLKLEDHLSLHKADLLARHSWMDSEPLDLFSDIDQSMQAIAEFASDRDADNYREFARQTEQVFNTLNNSFMQAQRPNPIALSIGGGLQGMVDLANTQPFISLWRSLSKRFDDPRLRQLFARYATYCGSSPFKAPATLMLIAHVERAGVWLLDGGMQALASTLSDTLESLGADCRYGDGVARIETRHDRVSAVVLESGEIIRARAVVFNGDTQALAAGLLGDEIKRACKPRREASLSAVTRCQVARVEGFDLAHHTVFFGNDYPDEFERIFTHRDMTDHPTVYVCAQDRSGHAQPEVAGSSHERLFSLVNAPAATMSQTRIDQALARMQTTLTRQGLKISDEQGQTRITDPGQFDALFPASDGALYGRPTHGWMGSFNRPGARSRLKGLYLAGGSVHPGAGVPMAALSGQLAADQLHHDMIT